MFGILNRSLRVAARTETRLMAEPERPWRDPIARRAAVFDWIWHDRPLGRPEDRPRL